jgi:hypothetical protein
MTLYPETQKAENISRGNKSLSGLKTFTNDCVCKRCGETILAGTPLIWIRGQGTWHKDNPCGVSE